MHIKLKFYYFSNAHVPSYSYCTTLCKMGQPGEAFRKLSVHTPCLYSIQKLIYKPLNLINQLRMSIQAYVLPSMHIKLKFYYFSNAHGPSYSYCTTLCKMGQPGEAFRKLLEHTPCLYSVQKLIYKPLNLTNQLCIRIRIYSLICKFYYFSNAHGPSYSYCTTLCNMGWLGQAFRKLLELAPCLYSIQKLIYKPLNLTNQLCIGIRIYSLICKFYYFSNAHGPSYSYCTTLCNMGWLGEAFRKLLELAPCLYSIQKLIYKPLNLANQLCIGICIAFYAY